MSVRITQGSVNRSYLKNLNKSHYNMNNSMEKIETGRAFTKVSEDVAGATKAMDIREKLYKNEQMQENTNTAIEQLKMAEDSIADITDMCSTTYSDMLRAMNGSNLTASKDTFLSTLEGMKTDILRMANTTYNNKYVMGGTGVETAPFKADANGYLVFNTYDVTEADGSVTKVPARADQMLNKQEMLKAIASGTIKDTDGTDKSLTDPEKSAMTEAVNNSKATYFIAGKAVNYSDDSYMDIGLDMSGPKTNPRLGVTVNELNSRNSFKTNVDGMFSLGYGKTIVTAEELNNLQASTVSGNNGQVKKAGDYEVSNNIYDMISDMQKAIEDEDVDKLSAILVNFKKQTDNLITSRAEIGTRSKYLETTLNRLENENVSLHQRQTDVEGVDDATEITNYMNYQNAWNLTMQFGGNIIPKSLMDYI